MKCLANAGGARRREQARFFTRFTGDAPSGIKPSASFFARAANCGHKSFSIQFLSDAADGRRRKLGMGVFMNIFSDAARDAGPSMGPFAQAVLDLGMGSFARAALNRSWSRSRGTLTLDTGVFV